MARSEVEKETERITLSICKSKHFLATLLNLLIRQIRSLRTLSLASKRANLRHKE